MALGPEALSKAPVLRRSSYEAFQLSSLPFLDRCLVRWELHMAIPQHAGTAPHMGNARRIANEPLRPHMVKESGVEGNVVAALPWPPSSCFCDRHKAA